MSDVDGATHVQRRLAVISKRMIEIVRFTPRSARIEAGTTTFMGSGTTKETALGTIGSISSKGILDAATETLKVILVAIKDRSCGGGTMHSELLALATATNCVAQFGVTGTHYLVWSLDLGQSDPTPFLAKALTALQKFANDVMHQRVTTAMTFGECTFRVVGTDTLKWPQMRGPAMKRVTLLLHIAHSQFKSQFTLVDDTIMMYPDMEQLKETRATVQNAGSVLDAAEVDVELSLIHFESTDDTHITEWNTAYLEGEDMKGHATTEVDQLIVSGIAARKGKTYNSHGTDA
jgi:hypothetical protein